MTSYDDLGEHRDANNDNISENNFFSSETEPGYVSIVPDNKGFIDSGEKDLQSNLRDNCNLSEAPSIPYVNWPIVGGKYTRNPMNAEMERHFENLFSLEELKHFPDSEDSTFTEHELCFHEVPTGKAVSQTIYIKNDSMICSYYESCIVNNFERPQKTMVVCDPEETEKNIRKQLNKGDEWYRRASKERGLTVFVEPAQGKLPAEDYVSFQVTVYALSWGHYTDALILQLGDLDQLCLKLSIRVSQSPVSVPPVLRFGAVSVEKLRECKKLRVQNISTLPLYICWHVFSPQPEPLPFTAMLFDDNPFQFHITSYFGSFMSPHFQIPKMYTFIAPFSQANVQVEFSPKNSNVSTETLSKTHEAILVGHVYLTDEARYMTNTESCIRDDGLKLEPLKISLEAFVELPVLSLLNVFNYQLIFKCTSYDVMSTKDKVWSKEKVITVKNESNLDIKAEVTTVGYFFISRINYPCDTTSKSTREIFLQPSQTCEVTVGCRVTQDVLYECFEEEEMLPPDVEIQTGIVEYGLVSFVQNHIKQDVKLELWLYQPLLHLSVMALNFGLVYLEDTKISIVTISAPLGREIFKTFIKSGDSTFCVNENSGILEPQSGFPVQISFTPKACVIYRDILVIQSCLDRIFWEIPLSGIGTFNYKNHIY